MMRLDVYLIENAFCSSRNKAQELIRSGGVKIDGKVCLKPAQMIGGRSVELVNDAREYVSRAAHKLDIVFNAKSTQAGCDSSLQPNPPHLVNESNRLINPSGKVCLDIGACTGGFTQALLNHGAKKVVALDVGHNQLSPILQKDARVVNLEGVNIRNITSRNAFKEILAQSGEALETAGKLTQFDIIVVDISFISVTFAIPAIKSLLNDGGCAVVLIKPQFELGKQKMSKTRGVVKSAKLILEAVNSVIDAFKDVGLTPLFTAPSTVIGSKGNQEFLTVFTAR